MRNNSRVALIAMVVALLSFMVLTPSQSSQVKLTTQERFANCCGSHMGH